MSTLHPHSPQNGDIVPQTGRKTNTLSVSWQKTRSKTNKASVVVGIPVTTYLDNYSHEQMCLKWKCWFRWFSHAVIVMWASGGGSTTTLCDSGAPAGGDLLKPPAGALISSNTSTLTASPVVEKISPSPVLLYFYKDSCYIMWYDIVDFMIQSAFSLLIDS